MASFTIYIHWRAMYGHSFRTVINTGRCYRSSNRHKIFLSHPSEPSIEIFHRKCTWCSMHLVFTFPWTKLGTHPTAFAWHVYFQRKIPFDGAGPFKRGGSCPIRAPVTPSRVDYWSNGMNEQSPLVHSEGKRCHTTAHSYTRAILWEVYWPFWTLNKTF